MAASALRPIAVDFIDLLAGSDYEIEELKITENLAQIELFTTQNEKLVNFSKPDEAKLLATKVSGQLIGNPKDQISISPGMIMIFLGSQDQLDRVKDRLKEVLVKNK